MKVTATAAKSHRQIKSDSVVIIGNSIIICSGLLVLHAFQVQNWLANQWIFKAGEDRARLQVRKAYWC